jgi:hypothetical protein
MSHYRVAQVIHECYLAASTPRQLDALNKAVWNLRSAVNQLYAIPLAETTLFVCGYFDLLIRATNLLPNFDWHMLYQHVNNIDIMLYMDLTVSNAWIPEEHRPHGAFHILSKDIYKVVRHRAKRCFASLMQEDQVVLSLEHFSGFTWTNEERVWLVQQLLALKTDWTRGSHFNVLLVLIHLWSRPLIETHPRYKPYLWEMIARNPFLVHGAPTAFLEMCQRESDLISQGGMQIFTGTSGTCEICRLCRIIGNGRYGVEDGGLIMRTFDSYWPEVLMVMLHWCLGGHLIPHADQPEDIKAFFAVVMRLPEDIQWLICRSVFKPDEWLDPQRLLRADRMRFIQRAVLMEL